MDLLQSSLAHKSFVSSSYVWVYLLSLPLLASQSYGYCVDECAPSKIRPSLFHLPGLIQHQQHAGLKSPSHGLCPVLVHRSVDAVCRNPAGDREYGSRSWEHHTRAYGGFVTLAGKAMEPDCPVSAVLSGSCVWPRGNLAAYEAVVKRQSACFSASRSCEVLDMRHRILRSGSSSGGEIRSRDKNLPFAIFWVPTISVIT